MQHVDWRDIDSKLPLICKATFFYGNLKVYVIINQICDYIFECLLYLTVLRREANLVDLDVVEGVRDGLVVEQISIVTQLLGAMLLVFLYLLQFYHVVAAVYQSQSLCVVLGQIPSTDIQGCHEAFVLSAAVDLVGVNIVTVLKSALTLVIAACLGLGIHRVAPTAALPHDHRLN